MPEATNPAVWTLAGSALTGLITLVGVAVTQRSSTGRELTNRTWEKRADLYLDLMQWSIDSNEYVFDTKLIRYRVDIDLNEIQAMELPRTMVARVQAFASGRVRDAVGGARASVHVLKVTKADPTGNTEALDDALHRVNSTFGDVRKTIRNELAKYTDKPPLRDRVRTPMWRATVWSDRSGLLGVVGRGPTHKWSWVTE